MASFVTWTANPANLRTACFASSDDSTSLPFRCEVTSLFRFAMGRPEAGCLHAKWHQHGSFVEDSGICTLGD